MTDPLVEKVAKEFFDRGRMTWDECVAILTTLIAEARDEGKWEMYECLCKKMRDDGMLVSEPFYEGDRVVTRRWTWQLMTRTGSSPTFGTCPERRW